MEKCNLCPRKCGIDRSKTIGFCGVNEEIKIALYGLHQWEEPCISYGKGSGTIFFSGCNLRCCYCQNYDISTCGVGKLYDTQEVVDIIKDLEKQGAININLVTPTHYIKQLVEVFKIYKPSIPIVYNSSGYEDVVALKLIDKYIDIYLVDFKYYDNDLAIKLSKVKDYKEIAYKAIDFMCKSKADIFDGEVMKQGVIIRHLILPNHTYNSIQSLQFLKDNFKGRLVSLMAQYIPMGKANEMQGLNRKINRREYEKIVNKFIDLNLNGFIQEMDSANKCFVPNFND